MKVVAVAANQPQAELIIGRLAEIGITAVMQYALSNPEMGASGARTIYVEERDLERGRALLAVDEPSFSDEELTELSEAAGREARDLEGGTDNGKS
ncbi:MAG: putative prokaryotic signal transducing protein [Solirubrobacterales bacterium]|nr:putative prokaryotic signal transducing protein [Solirubrobacterales bacterium]